MPSVPCAGAATTNAAVALLLSLARTLFEDVVTSGVFLYAM
ncbi:hypothetical protein [Paenibacillus phytorum]|nr:hypothetical protein [Paenibacillus phytorum]